MPKASWGARLHVEIEHEGKVEHWKAFKGKVHNNKRVSLEWAWRCDAEGQTLVPAICYTMVIIKADRILVRPVSS